MNAISTRAPQFRLDYPAGCPVPPEQWGVLVDAIFPSAKTPEAVMLAVRYCTARRLDVFKRPVHIVPVWNKQLRREVETVWPGISELQVTAARTGQWCGMDAPEWGPEVERTFEHTDDRGQTTRATVRFPEWCSVTVYRLLAGQRCAFAEPVFWLENYARAGRSELPNEMWKKRPRGQLHKNAKAAALRAAFPEDMGNDYTADEMEGQEVEAGGVVIQHEARHAPVRRAPAAIGRSMPSPTMDLPTLDTPEPVAVGDRTGMDATLAGDDVPDFGVPRDAPPPGSLREEAARIQGKPAQTPRDRADWLVKRVAGAGSYEALTELLRHAKVAGLREELRADHADLSAMVEDAINAAEERVAPFPANLPLDGHPAERAGVEVA